MWCHQPSCHSFTLEGGADEEREVTDMQKMQYKPDELFDEESEGCLISEGPHNPPSTHDQNMATAFPKCNTGHIHPFFQNAFVIWWMTRWYLLIFIRSTDLVLS